MDDICVTYIDDEHGGNYDYDDNTGDDHKNNNNIYVYLSAYGNVRTGP